MKKNFLFSFLLAILIIKLVSTSKEPEFIQAVFNNDVEKVKFYLTIESTLDVNTRYLGLTALHYASGYGYTQMVETLIEWGADVHLIDSRHGEIALHKAAEGGHVDVARTLLSSGSFLDVRSGQMGNSPLVNAVWYKMDQVAEYLLSENALMYLSGKAKGATAWGRLNSTRGAHDRQQQNEWMDTHMLPKFQSHQSVLDSELQAHPLLQATLEHNTTWVEEILEKDVSDLNYRAMPRGDWYDSFTCLMISVMNNDHAITKLLLNSNANVTLIDDYWGMSALHLAGFNNSVESLNEILKVQNDTDFIDQQSKWFGFTPLNFAAFTGSTDVVQALVNCGSNETIKNEIGNMPLDTAKYYNYTDIVALLQSNYHLRFIRKSDQNINGENDNLYLIVEKNDLKSIYDWLTKYHDNRKKLNLRNNQGKTALMISAGLGFTQMTEILLVSGADPNLIDTANGKTALHYAAASGVVDVVWSLLNHGAFPDMHSAQLGHSPIMVAFLFKHYLVVDFLATTRQVYITTTTRYGKTLVELVDQFGDQLAMSMLKERMAVEIQSEIDRRNQYSESLSLIQAAMVNDSSTVKSILDSRLSKDNIQNGDDSQIDVNVQLPFYSTGNDAHTALLVASREGYTDVVKDLLQIGRARSDIIGGLMRSTSLHKSGYMGHTDSLKLLLEDGRGEIDAQGPENYYTCLHDSTWHGHFENVKLITQYTDNINLLAQNKHAPLNLAKMFNYTDIHDHLLTLITKTDPKKSSYILPNNGDTDNDNNNNNDDNNNNEIKAGESYTFQIITYDHNNTLRNNGGDQWIIKSNNDQIKFQITDLKNGKYNVEVSNALKSDTNFDIYITLNKLPLAGTPINLKVIPGKINLEKSLPTFTGQNSDCSNIGSIIKLQIVLCDDYDNCYIQKPTNSDIITFLSANTTLISNLYQNLDQQEQDKQYFSKFIVTTPGVYYPSLSIDNKKIESKDSITICSSNGKCDQKSKKCICENDTIGQACDNYPKNYGSLSNTKVGLIIGIPFGVVFIILIIIIYFGFMKKNNQQNKKKKKKMTINEEPILSNSISDSN
ncbi:repeat protein [Anaeramoeba flamelloides]|uniref:Repeat protein n=1 Tax=Anaeramoeba flamelloides TaxID=1746091 RepID=A0AAV8A9R4_9EUKA|nr:repeat protein [Anaeramoeba flamelloides]